MRTATADDGRVAAARQRLADVGGRRTAARTAVIEALAASGRHLSVGEIHDRIQSKHPTINVSTVHRTVATLAGHGIVHVLPWPGEARYGLADQPHHHGVCRRCGTVTEIPPAALATATTAAERSCGFDFHDADVTMVGLCPDCNQGGRRGAE